MTISIRNIVKQPAKFNIVSIIKELYELASIGIKKKITVLTIIR